MCGTRIPTISLLIIIINKNNILLAYKGNIEVYNSYLNLSIIAYNKYELEEEIINKIKNIPSEYYNSINNYLEELINITNIFVHKICIFFKLLECFIFEKNMF